MLINSGNTVKMTNHYWIGIVRTIPVCLIIIAPAVAQQETEVTGGFHIIGQLLVALTIIIVGAVLWQSGKNMFRLGLLRRFSTYVVIGIFIVLISILLYLMLAVFMGGQLTLLVIPGMIAGLVCITILLQAIRS